MRSLQRCLRVLLRACVIEPPPPLRGWTRSCRGRTRSCLVPGTIDFEAPTGTTDWDPVQWRGTTGNDRCGISNFRGTTEKVGRAARERTCRTKGHELKIE